MDFNEALNSLSRDERFKAAVSAMNTLLIQKGVYTQGEFEIYFCQWAEDERRKDLRGNCAPPNSKTHPLSSLKTPHHSTK